MASDPRVLGQHKSDTAGFQRGEKVVGDHKVGWVSKQGGGHLGGAGEAQVTIILILVMKFAKS